MGSNVHTLNRLTIGTFGRDGCKPESGNLSALQFREQGFTDMTFLL